MANIVSDLIEREGGPSDAALELTNCLDEILTGAFDQTEIPYSAELRIRFWGHPKQIEQLMYTQLFLAQRGFAPEEGYEFKEVPLRLELDPEDWNSQEIARTIIAGIVEELKGLRYKGEITSLQMQFLHKLPRALDEVTACSIS